MDIQMLFSRHLVSIDGKDTLQHAAMLMREHHVGAVVVTDGADASAHVTGLVTDRDLAIEVLSRGGDGSQVPVARLVRRPPVGISEHASAAQAVQAMQSAGVRRLLVQDDAGHLVGLLSLDDLIQTLAAPLAGLADVLRQGLLREVQARGQLAAPPRPALRVPAMGTAGWQSAPVGAPAPAR